jgi:integrase
LEQGFVEEALQDRRTGCEASPRSSYSLRHTAISEFIANGADSFIVARLAGTSTAMIDKHYGHLRHDKTRAKLDAIAML